MRTDEEYDAVVELLHGVVHQLCWDDINGYYDSGALSTYAEALRFLAKEGKISIVREMGRMVIASENNSAYDCKCRRCSKEFKSKVRDTICDDCRDIETQEFIDEFERDTEYCPTCGIGKVRKDRDKSKEV